MTTSFGKKELSVNCWNKKIGVYVLEVIGDTDLPKLRENMVLGTNGQEDFLFEMPVLRQKAIRVGGIQEKNKLVCGGSIIRYTHSRIFRHPHQYKHHLCCCHFNHHDCNHAFHNRIVQWTGTFCLRYLLMDRWWWWREESIVRHLVIYFSWVFSLVIFCHFPFIRW